MYGAGYTLEMKVRGGDRTPTTPSSDRHSDLKEFVAGLFPDATLEESFADRLMFSVPQHAVTSLAECFSQLEIGNYVYYYLYYVNHFYYLTNAFNYTKLRG